jgi:hypothetical protein
MIHFGNFEFGSGVSSYLPSGKFNRTLPLSEPTTKTFFGNLRDFNRVVAESSWQQKS